MIGFLQSARGKADTDDGWPNGLRDWNHWLDGVSKVDSRELAPRVRELLIALERRSMSATDRIRVLETINPAIRRVLDYLSTRVNAQPLPLPAAADEAYRTLVDVFARYAAAYELALDAPNGRPLSRRNVALAGERALSLHGERALRILQTYDALPAEFWQQVNATYALVENAGVAKREVRRNARGARARTARSPQRSYKRLLLLVLAGPFGFSRNDMYRVYLALDAWSALGRLADLAQAGDSGFSHFAIDLDEGTGPLALSEIPTGGNVRVLDASQLLVHIEHLHSSPGAQQRGVPYEEEIRGDLLARLRDSWLPGGHQRSERARRGSMVDAEVSLRAAHARITEDARPPGKQTETEMNLPSGWSIERDVRENIGLDGIHPVDHRLARDRRGVRAGVNWNDAPEPIEDLVLSEQTPATEPRAGGRAEADAGPRWLLEDVSATGFRLIWTSKGSCAVTVGEVIALRTTRTPDAGSRWCAGIVRRIRMLDANRFEIGVEIVARNAMAASVRPLGDSDRREQALDAAPDTPALLLPSDREAGKPAQILLPSRLNRDGETVELSLNGRTTRFALSRLREDTSIVSRYELSLPDRRGARRITRGKAGARRGPGGKRALAT